MVGGGEKDGDGDGDSLTRSSLEESVASMDGTRQAAIRYSSLTRKAPRTSVKDNGGAKATTTTTNGKKVVFTTTQAGTRTRNNNVSNATEDSSVSVEPTRKSTPAASSTMSSSPLNPSKTVDSLSTISQAKGATPTSTISASPPSSTILPPPSKGANKERKPVKRPTPAKGQPSMTRMMVEVEQLRRRFGSVGRFHCEYRPDENAPLSATLQFNMPIDDPDFPFDLESLHLHVELPVGYPQMGRPAISVVDEKVPANVRQRIQNRMRDATEQMPQGELIMRPLLRILANNLEKWMVALPTISSGSSNIRIIPATRIVVSPAPNRPSPTNSALLTPIPLMASSGHSSENVNLHPNSSAPLSEASASTEALFSSLALHSVGMPLRRTIHSSSSSQEHHQPDGQSGASSLRSRFMPPEFIHLEPVSASRIAGTIQIDLNNLKMVNVAILVPITLGVVFCCVRCRHGTPITDLRPDVDRRVVCAKCQQHSEVHYIREALHEGSPCRAGFLRTKRTSPLDLLPSTFQATCATCSPPSPLSSSVKIESVRVGELVEFVCPNCHQSCSFHYQRVTWTPLPAPSGSGGANQAQVKQAKLPTKVGEPLPDFGTCEHYKKSCRWFRFPCCGRAYPCDECHAEDPANRDHPVEWANRQICGYCSREFSTSQKYCECGQTPGLLPSKTAHWEGGKGMRDQTAMSRKDRKKYRNQQKTLSNKAKTSKP